jgi:hypothetical protein
MAKGHKYNITNLLGLEGLKVLEVVEEEEGFIVIEVQAKKRKAFCPHCGSKHLYKHGKAKPRKGVTCFYLWQEGISKDTGTAEVEVQDLWSYLHSKA